MLRFAAVVVIAVAAGCRQAPVEWTEAAGPALPLDTASLTPDLRGVATLPSVACPGSVRMTRSGAILNAVWWMPRADSSARLEFARSIDGGAHWTIHSPVDTTDRGVAGCRRVPPAIAADPASGYIHVAYALSGAEGPGLFFSHSMDNGALFHSPVPILYGERPGYTAVASSGDVVAVAFEDPNSTTPRIGLALSRTMGHIFEHRVLPVSADNGAASQPMVAVRGTQLAVAWHERSSSTGTTTVRVRSGTLR